MKLNIACPTTGSQIVLDVEEEKKLRIFYDQRIAQEVDATPLGDQFKGYILRITGGSDKDGFPMKQGVLTNTRVRIMLRPGTVGFRRSEIQGMRKRRTVRGCIVGADLAALNLVVVKKGEAEIPGLTDKVVPRRLGPKRASKIRKLFDLTKEDDVRKYVIAKTRPNKKDPSKPHIRKPKIQRLVTSARLQRKRRERAIKKARWTKSAAEASAYAKLLEERAKERKEKRQAAYEAKRKAAKLAKMLAIRRALKEKRIAKFEAAKKRAAAIEAAKKKRAEREAAGKKLSMRPEAIARRKKLALRNRRKAWIAARKALSAARQVTMQKLRKEKRMRRFLVQRLAKPIENAWVRKKLIKKRIMLEQRAQTTPEILTKMGAIKFLGKNSRLSGKKARLAKKAAKAAAAAKKVPATK